VIALTSVLEDAKVVGAVKAGAIGYLLKDTHGDELCRAIKAAAAGQVQLSPQAAARLMREVRAPESPETLTERETDACGCSPRKANKEIAVALSIGENTVKTHVSNVLEKLGVQSRTQAALYAAQIGLVRSRGRDSHAHATPAGPKLHLWFVVFLVLLGGATAGVMLLGFERSQDNASRRSSEGLEEQGRQQLEFYAAAQADIGYLQFASITSAAQQVAQVIFPLQESSGAAAQWDSSHLVVGSGASCMTGTLTGCPTSSSPTSSH
jgi:DNA-binding CsgD family transcriptional regulator